METKNVVRWSERFAETLLSSLASQLSSLGYAARTIDLYMRACRGFVKWSLKHCEPLPVVTNDSIERFLKEHLSSCDCHPRCPAIHTSRAAVRHLRRLCDSRHGCDGTNHSDPIETEVEAFDQHLEEVRGLASTTRHRRKQCIREFLISRFGSGPVRTELLRPQDLMGYVSTRVRGSSPGTAAAFAGSIRSYLKYLQFRGDIDPGYLCVIPSLPIYRLADYPEVLSESQVSALTGSFDLHTPAGMRDHAMALCMLHMGLRAGEVASLELDDIDWRGAVIRLNRGKTRRCRELPLPTTCGTSIVRYLKHGRPPKAAQRRLFLRHTVPVGIPLAAENVRGAMRRAYGRAGFPPRWTGTHVLRHTAATRMLENGATLKELADVLGHQSIDTTAIYTKVNFVALETATLRWPEVRS